MGALPRRIIGRVIAATLILAAPAAAPQLAVVDPAGLKQRAAEYFEKANRWRTTVEQYTGEVEHWTTMFNDIKQKYMMFNCFVNTGSAAISSIQGLAAEGQDGLKDPLSLIDTGSDLLDVDGDPIGGLMDQIEDAGECLTDPDERINFRNALHERMLHQQAVNNAIRDVDCEDHVRGTANIPKTGPARGEWYACEEIAIVLDAIDADMGLGVEDGGGGAMADSPDSVLYKTDESSADGSAVLDASSSIRNAQAKARVRMEVSRQLQSQGQKLNSDANAMRNSAGSKLNDAEGLLTAMQAAAQYDEAMIAHMNSLSFHMESQAELLVALVEIGEQQLALQRMRTHQRDGTLRSTGNPVDDAPPAPNRRVEPIIWEE